MNQITQIPLNQLVPAPDRCPFCDSHKLGSETFHTNQGIVCRIVCRRCQARGPERLSTDNWDTIQAWNQAPRRLNQ